MYSRKIERFFPKPVIIVAYALAIGGIVVIFFEWVIAVFILAISLFAITGHEGIIIDKTRHTFKIYYSILFIKFGSWESIPKFARLMIVPERLSYKKFSLISNDDITEKSFSVRLYYPSSDYIIASRGDLNKVKEDARFLSELLKLKAEDFSDADLDELLRKEAEENT